MQQGIRVCRRGHRGQPPPGHRDRVDLLDEADRSTFAPRCLAQRTEVGADLACRRAVVHRLERRRRHEQEGHPGLAGHRLGHVRLAGSRQPFEEQPSPGSPAHLAGERAMREEQVEGTDHVLLDGIDPLDVVEGHADLFGPERDVRRPPGSDGRAEQHHDHREQQQHRHHHERLQRRQLQREEIDRVPDQQPPPQPRRGQRKDEGESPEAALPAALPSRPDVRLGGEELPHPGIGQQGALSSGRLRHQCNHPPRSRPCASVVVGIIISQPAGLHYPFGRFHPAELLMRSPAPC